jgi:hypothetical protein
MIKQDIAEDLQYMSIHTRFYVTFKAWLFAPDNRNQPTNSTENSPSEMSIGSQLGKKFPQFYGVQSPITKAHHLSVSWAW